uniref:G2/mitotic-specific cyclin-A-like n=1 Tax=Styela clava TaxID=7725 RepID=UPI0019394AD6|nr:G2/mitotic-specific cyclin-A-like [Styela clava]
MFASQANTENPNQQHQMFGKRDENTRQRAVLGELNQNTIGGRVQPFRAAKQNATTEGFFTSLGGNKPASASNDGFKIFDETACAVSVAESTKPVTRQSTLDKSSLPAALTALPSISRAPLTSLPVPEQHESPMVLDTTLNSSDRSSISDIDAESSVYGVSEYATEIFEHLRQAETRNRPKANYMRKQQDITASMRSILVDWLIEVSEEYKLHTETTHLAVNYIDRFLSHMAVMRAKLQLVGTAAMFLAAKFEEIYPPDVGEFVYITDDTYTKKQVLRMEHLILKVLSFDVAVPTSNQFLPRFLKAACADRKTEMLASYLCELALNDCEMVAFLPSFVAASAVCLASYAVSGKIWDETMQHYMQYNLDELAPCISKLYNLFNAAPGNPQQAARDKYKEAKMECVSLLKMPASLPFEELQ